MVDVLFMLFIIFLLAFLVQLYFFLGIFVPLSKFKEPKSHFSSGVSVVVCGYNEAKYWNQLVDQLLKQDYEQEISTLQNLLATAQRDSARLHSKCQETEARSVAALDAKDQEIDRQTERVDT